MPTYSNAVCITPQEKTATQSTFHPHFLADPFASSKFNVMETFWQSHFASSKLNVRKIGTELFLRWGPLSFGAGYHMPHSKSKGLEQLLQQNININKHVHSDNRTTASLLQRKDKNKISNNNILHSYNGTEGTDCFGSQSETQGLTLKSLSPWGVDHFHYQKELSTHFFMNVCIY